MSALEIKPREKKQKYQVRFWCDKELYEQFTKKCDNNEIVYQDAFRDLMKYWLRSRKP